MIKILKRYSGFIALVLLSAGVIWKWICLDSPEHTIFIGILGILVTLFFGFLNYQMESDRIFKDLFVSFNNRYTKEINDTLNDLRNKKDRELSNEEKNMVNDYFNLCAEEYLWYSKNRIPKTIWKAWRAGMLENLEIPQVRILYDQEMKSENNRLSYYGLDKELSKPLK